MPDVPAGESTHPSLLEGLRDPTNTEAWRVFASVYAPLVYGYCRQRGLQDADAADVVQEVLARVSRAMRTFDYRPERGRFRDWLGTVTRRCLCTLLRRRGPDSLVGGDNNEDPDQIVAPEANAEWTAEFHARVFQAALERTRPHFVETTWRAFQRSWLDNQTPLDTARELNMPVATIYVARSRVLKRLRVEILALAEDLPPCVPL
jgi:RNA polymerase sigma factor (sigma-70 family)